MSDTQKDLLEKQPIHIKDKSLQVTYNFEKKGNSNNEQRKVKTRNNIKNKIIYPHIAIKKSPQQTKDFYQKFFNDKSCLCENTTWKYLQQHKQKLQTNKIFLQCFRSIRKIKLVYNSKTSKVLIFKIFISYFEIDISVFSLKDNPEKRFSQLLGKFTQQVGIGSEGQVFGIDQTTVVKKQYVEVQNVQSISEIIFQIAICKLISCFGLTVAFKNYFQFDAILDQNFIYFCLQKGQNIQSKASEIQNIQMQLKENLQFLHYLYIVHNDIKPANIIYSPTFNRFVLIDFGLSQNKHFNRGFMIQQYFKGTYQSSSPQLTKLFRTQQMGFVNLYYNDVYGLLYSLQTIKDKFKSIRWDNRQWQQNFHKNTNDIYFDYSRSKSLIQTNKIPYHQLENFLNDDYKLFQNIQDNNLKPLRKQYLYHYILISKLAFSVFRKHMIQIEELVNRNMIFFISITDQVSLLFFYEFHISNELIQTYKRLFKNRIQNIIINEQNTIDSKLSPQMKCCSKIIQKILYYFQYLQYHDKIQNKLIAIRNLKYQSQEFQDQNQYLQEKQQQQLNLILLFILQFVRLHMIKHNQRILEQLVWLIFQFINVFSLNQQNRIIISEYEIIKFIYKILDFIDIRLFTIRNEQFDSEWYNKPDKKHKIQTRIEHYLLVNHISSLYDGLFYINSIVNRFDKAQVFKHLQITACKYLADQHLHKNSMQIYRFYIVGMQNQMIDYLTNCYEYYQSNNTIIIIKQYLQYHLISANCHVKDQNCVQKLKYIQQSNKQCNFLKKVCALSISLGKNWLSNHNILANQCLSIIKEFYQLCNDSNFILGLQQIIIKFQTRLFQFISRVMCKSGHIFQAIQYLQLLSKKYQNIKNPSQNGLLLKLEHVKLGLIQSVYYKNSFKNKTNIKLMSNLRTEIKDQLKQLKIPNFQNAIFNYYSKKQWLQNYQNDKKQKSNNINDRNQKPTNINYPNQKQHNINNKYNMIFKQYQTKLLMDKNLSKQQIKIKRSKNLRQLLNQNNQVLTLYIDFQTYLRLYQDELFQYNQFQKIDKIDIKILLQSLKTMHSNERILQQFSIHKVHLLFFNKCEQQIQKLNLNKIDKSTLFEINESTSIQNQNNKSQQFDSKNFVRNIYYTYLNFYLIFCQRLYNFLLRYQVNQLSKEQKQFFKKQCTKQLSIQKNLPQYIQKNNKLFNEEAYIRKFKRFRKSTLVKCFCQQFFVKMNETIYKFTKLDKQISKSIRIDQVDQSIDQTINQGSYWIVNNVNYYLSIYYHVYIKCQNNDKINQIFIQELIKQMNKLRKLHSNNNDKKFKQTLQKFEQNLRTDFFNTFRQNFNQQNSFSSLIVLGQYLIHQICNKKSIEISQILNLQVSQKQYLQNTILYQNLICFNSIHSYMFDRMGIIIICLRFRYYIENQMCQQFLIDFRLICSFNYKFNSDKISKQIIHSLTIFAAKSIKKTQLNVFKSQNNKYFLQNSISMKLIKLIGIIESNKLQISINIQKSYINALQKLNKKSYKTQQKIIQLNRCSEIISFYIILIQHIFEVQKLQKALIQKQNLQKIYFLIKLIAQNIDYLTSFSMQFIFKHYYIIFISYNKKLIKRIKADLNKQEQSDLTGQKSQKISDLNINQKNEQRCIKIKRKIKFQYIQTLRNPILIIQDNILLNLFYRKHKTLIYKRIQIMQRFKNKINKIVSIKKIVQDDL